MLPASISTDYSDLRAVVGFNFGYVDDGHDGINHGQLLARASYQVIREMEVYAYTGYNRAVDRDRRKHPGDKLLRDFFWGGASLSYRF